ncbi:MAG: DUF6430 domain-containing protein [Gammaproteobacteria bacterium]|nr:DUF6430 domain-containing protein [Gammaproteobacteria bacterium]
MNVLDCSYLRWFFGSFGFRKFFGSILQSLGVLLVFDKIVERYSQNNDWLEFWVGLIGHMWTLWVVIIIGLAMGLFRAWPRNRVGARIQGKDVDVEVRIKNIFSSSDAMVVGCNTTFDIRGKIISERSIQGQCAKRYFNGEESFAQKITKALRNVAPLGTQEEGANNDHVEYEMGTTIAVIGRLRKRFSEMERKIYLVAIARINDYGAATADDTEFLGALPKMWEEIRTKGGMENLDCPILGSGFSRLKMNRQQLIDELIRSFIAATHEGKLTEKITFYISPSDFMKGSLEMKKISRFLEHECERLPVPSAAVPPDGIPLTS